MTVFKSWWWVLQCAFGFHDWVWHRDYVPGYNLRVWKVCVRCHKEKIVPI